MFHKQKVYLSFIGLIIGLGGMACIQALAQDTKTAPQSASTSLARAALPQGKAVDFGQAPPVPTGQLSDELVQALDTLFIRGLPTRINTSHLDALKVVANSEDPRIAWLLTDFLRFISDKQTAIEVTKSLEKLLGLDLQTARVWHESTNHLIAWDIPAPPDYLFYKRAIFVSILPEWSKIFVEGNVDWRHVSWGGVRIDDRPYDKTDSPCNCIPAADNPPVTDAKTAMWLDDSDIIFGIHVNGEYRAYPRQIMEVREMVNDTLGGRTLGIPYCTLCGSAQAWFTDVLPSNVARPILRTSGLLSRSNKVMFDLNSYSVFDTFRGQALTGSLLKKKIQLTQASVITTTWGAWKKAHPSTTVLKEHLALGRDFDFRNGRDAKGPIFPIGDTDPRLPVQEDILGTHTASGKPVAFHVDSLIKVLDAGEAVEVENIKIVMDARGVRAIDENGKDLGTHQSFWFAWSQFYPDTLLWPQT